MCCSIHILRSNTLSTMTDSEKAMVDEMSELIKDQNQKICDQYAYIQELLQQMSDMHDREYDC